MSQTKPIPAGEEITGAITKHMDRRFLSSIDFMGLGDVALTIGRCEKLAELRYLNGNTEKNAILLYFVETSKPLVLNTTNIRSIVELTGTTKVKDWAGVKITLYTIEGTFFGKPGHAVRIKGAE
jgi:hypothetical protein